MNYKDISKAPGRMGRALQRRRAGFGLLLILLALAQIPAPALARGLLPGDAENAKPSVLASLAAAQPNLDRLGSRRYTPAAQSGSESIKFYLDEDVDCDDPQGYEQVELPFQSWHSGSGGSEQWLYMCSPYTTTVNLHIWASAGGSDGLLGQTDSYLNFGCSSGDCTDPDLFEQKVIQDLTECGYANSLYDREIELPAGKYNLLLWAHSRGDSDDACPATQFYGYELDVNPPTAKDFSRTLAKEDACLANNPSDLGFVGDPVNTYSGNFSHSVEDAFIAARGLPLNFERSYNSLDSATDGPLGYGWTHNYNMNLSFESYTATLKAPRGSRLTFEQQANGSFVASPGVRATLVEQGDGYQLTRADQISYLFDSQGRLTTIKDSNGNQTTLEYNASGHLTRIAAPGGLRDLLLGYDPQGRISSLSAGGQTVSYGYTPAGELVSVNDLRGFVSEHEYEQPASSSLHLLTVITDPNENELAISYNEQGQVLRDAKSCVSTITGRRWRYSAAPRNRPRCITIAAAC